MKRRTKLFQVHGQIHRPGTKLLAMMMAMMLQTMRKVHREKGANISLGWKAELKIKKIILLHYLIIILQNISIFILFTSFINLAPQLLPQQNFDIKLIILKKNLLLLSLWVFFVFRWPFRIYGHFGTFRPNFFKRKC